MTRTLTLAMALMLAASTPAFAQGTPDQAAAQALFDEGIRLFNAADYDAACAKLEASLKLVDAMGTRGKLAECFEKDGRTASAWAAYREVAVLAGRSGQLRRQEVANERAQRLKQVLSYLTVSVPEQARVDGLQVSRNGSVLQAGAYGAAIAVDPGTQTIEASAPGHESWSSTVTIAASSRETVEVIALTVLPVEVEPVVEDFMVDKNATGDGGRNMRLIGMGAVGVGAVSIITSVVLGFKAKSDYDGAFDDGLCNDEGVCNSDGVAVVDDSRGLANLATGLAVGGVVIAGIGGYLWWDSMGSKEDATAISIAPVAGSDSFGFSITGQY